MLKNQPDSAGFFGAYGGAYVAEPLQHAIAELRDAYFAAREDPTFQTTLDEVLAEYVGRPSPIYHATNLSQLYGCQVYLKREDLNHTGAHKINNAIGQVALAQRMGKERIIAETGAGQHGVATAAACARAGLACVIYMGAADIARQAPNVARMRLLGAQVQEVTTGTCTLKDALNEALRDWVANIATTFYVIGSAAGPHPYPLLVRDFNAIVGKECRTQMSVATGRQPDAIIACVGGGSNAIGIFHPYLDDQEVQLYGVEAGGDGLTTGRHAAPLTSGAPEGILHGMRTAVMQDDAGQVLGTKSAAAGLDYPAVGPEHAWLQAIGRATYVAVTDPAALQAFDDCCRLEGIVPAFESAHALAYAQTLGSQLGSQASVLVNLSGRGDKDLDAVLAYRKSTKS